MSKLEREWFSFNERTLNILLIAATGLFTSSSILSARKSKWEADETLTVIAIVLAIFVGFTTKITTP